MATRITTTPADDVARHFNGISSRFSQGARHLYLSLNGKFQAIYATFDAGDYSRCASVIEDLRDSQVVKDISNTISIASDKLSELTAFLTKQLGPFLQLVFGASLVAILPVAGGAAIGAAVGVGASLGTLLGILLILAGILIMLHAMMKMS